VRRRRRGLAFDAVFLVLGLALLAAGVLDLAGGATAIGTVELVVAAAISWIFGTSLSRRFRRGDPSLVEAVGAAAVFAAFGLLGLAATFSGDAVRIVFGALAAAILLPLTAVIVVALFRSRAAARR
jgi:hypothetical protein